MAMRDIRPDIDDRLQELADEKRKLTERLNELAQVETQLRTLQALEERRWQAMAQTDLPLSPAPITLRLSRMSNTAEFRYPLVKPGDLPPFSQLLFSLVDEMGPSTTAELAAAVTNRGFPFGKKSPVRSTHFGLVGLKRVNLVEMHEGKWRRLPEHLGMVREPERTVPQE
jgi:hypothetical protein